jgi:hypothetical protein
MAFLKRKITNKAFKTLDKLQKFMEKIIQKHINIELIKSITITNSNGNAINKSCIK